MNVVCFHNPNEINGYLSNWYKSEFIFGESSYSSMEQYMMHQKALTFGDEETAAKILAASEPADIKSLGRLVSNYSDIYWSGIRQLVVFDGLVAKFTQNDTLRQKLLDTGDDILAECAVKDRIWGIGLSMTDQRRLDMSQWQGQNLLGFALMRVRNKLSHTMTNSSRINDDIYFC